VPAIDRASCSGQGSTRFDREKTTGREKATGRVAERGSSGNEAQPLNKGSVTFHRIGAMNRIRPTNDKHPITRENDDD
jgi:hypothetical protein